MAEKPLNRIEQISENKKVNKPGELKKAKFRP
jgi:hypothetical protein